MSYATQLGTMLKQAGVLSRTGELATFLLNRLSGKARLGHQLLNAGSADRIQAMKGRHLTPMVGQLRQAVKSAPVEDVTALGERLGQRQDRFEQIAGRARNSRMEGIGAGTIGLGLGGAAMAATDESQS